MSLLEVCKWQNQKYTQGQSICLSLLCGLLSPTRHGFTIYSHFNFYDKRNNHFFFLYPHPRICFLLIIEKKKGREGGREREKHQYERETSLSCLPYTPQPGVKAQPRYVSWLRIEPVTFWCLGWCSNQLNYLAKASPFVVLTEFGIILSSETLNFWLWDFTLNLFFFLRKINVRLANLAPWYLQPC